MTRKKKQQSEREAVFTQTKEGPAAKMDIKSEIITNSENGTNPHISAGLTHISPAAKIDLKNEDIDIAGNAVLNPVPGGHDGN